MARHRTSETLPPAGAPGSSGQAPMAQGRGGALFRLCSRLFIATYGRWPVLGELRGSVAVIRRGEEFLLQWRSDGLGWAFPGGTARFREDPERTLRRELREETGLLLDDCRRLFTYSDRRYVPMRITVFAARAGGEPRPSWEGRPEWRRLPAEPFFSSQRAILAYLDGHPFPF